MREYFLPRVDRGRDDPNLRLDGKAYAKGLALHSKTELVYRLPPKSNRFLAIAGIDDSVGNEGNVLFKILGDGKELYSGTFRGADKAMPLDINISGVRKLTLVVDYGEDLDVGDYFDLADARIVK
ncbi:MAG: NPCBM/NEW2 domain-containing protein [Pirellulales bacterium]